MPPDASTLHHFAVCGSIGAFTAVAIYSRSLRSINCKTRAVQRVPWRNCTPLFGVYEVIRLRLHECYALQLQPIPIVRMCHWMPQLHDLQHIL